jgi:hypothetical protein
MKYGIIMKKGDTYLMIPNAKQNRWMFPSGSKKPYETPLECVQRILFDTTGMYFDMKDWKEKHFERMFSTNRRFLVVDWKEPEQVVSEYTHFYTKEEIMMMYTDMDTKGYFSTRR